MYLDYNQLSSSIPTSLGNLSNLQGLHLNYNQLNGPIPTSLGNLTHLICFSIADNQLDGSIPSSLGNLSHLQEMYLLYNKINGAIPSSLGNLLELQHLNLASNQLSDAIPSSLGNLSKLNTLYLFDNQLNGNIPSSLGNLSNLFNLVISGNQLNGAIPSSLSNLSKLEELDLSYNQLDGGIPSSLGILSKIEVLDLSNNLLTGAIPESLGNLTNLEYLDLGDNKFNSMPLLQATFQKIIQLQSNSLSFDDIIPNLSHISNYSPQNKIGLSKTTNVTIGNTYTLNLGIDSSLTTNTYKWYKNGQLFSTTAINKLVINNVANTDAGVYTCTITNPDAPDLTLYSNPDTLVVKCGSPIITQPTDQTVCDGTAATFSVTATGTGLTYQWQQTPDGGVTWNTINGATNATYSFTTSSSMNDYFYHCIISGGCATPDTSDDAQLTVNLPPQIITQPTDQLVNEGTNAGFSVGATGTDLNYQWQQSTDGGTSWTPLSDETSAYFQKPEVTRSMNAYMYRCIVSNTYGFVTSGASRLFINANAITYIRPPDTNYQVIDKNLPVGATPGVINISPTGGATYSIPIACPPGLGNMKPNISLAYNSQSGNGLLGWGWNVTGISAISRVPQTVYSDGVATGLNLSTSDRFALDGNRLVSYSGTYGADNSTYRTENETFVNIVSHGSSYNNSPASFEVKDKSGNTYKYGIGNGHLFYDYGGGSPKHATLAWFLDYASDIHGNFMSYDYEQRGLYTYLKKITYGCNANNNSLNNYTVNFTYKKRTDTIPLHVDLIKSFVDLLIDSITVKNADTVYRQYVLNYIFDVFSRLVKITEINGAGEHLNPTIIKWGANNKQISMSAPVVGLSENIAFSGQYYSSADVNGDGLTDIVSIYPHDNNDNYCGTQDDACSCENGVCHTNYVQVYYASLATDHTVKFTPGTPYDVGPNINFDFKSYITGNSSGDVDGDGKSEVIVAKYKKLNNSVSSQVYFYILNHDGSKPIAAQNLQKGAEMPLYAIADFNNDGIDEILYMEKDFMSVDANSDHIFAAGIRCLDNLGHGIWDPFQIALSAPFPKQLFVLDFNGDGLKDLLIVNDSGYEVLLNTGDTKVTLSTGEYYTKPTFGYKRYFTNFDNSYAIKLGDFNGDGLADFILSKKGVAFGEWYLAMNSGRSGFDIKPLPGIVACDDKDSQLDDDKDNCMVTDFNNDGKSDVIITNANYNWKHNWIGPYWKVFDRVTTYWYESIGEGLRLAHPPSVSTNEIDAYNRFSVIGDFNGDGRPDLMNYGYNCYKDTFPETTGWKLYTSANNKYEGGMVTAISDGMKRKTTISYSSLAARENYTVGSFLATPLANLSQPLYVVKRTDNTGGVLGKLSTKYSYADAIVYPLRGFLGFGKVTALDSVKQTAVDNYYTFSKTAGTETFYMPYLTKTVTSLNNAPIGQTETDYALDTLGGKHIWMYQKLAVAENFLKNTRDSSITFYNADGNLISSEIKNLDAASSAIVSTKKVTYNNYADRIPTDGNPYPNAPGNVVTELTHADAPGKKSTDTTALVYNTDGTINQKISFAGRAKSVTNTYTYYPNGNINTESVSSSGLTTRTSTSTYDATGRFLATHKNTLNHKTTYVYDNFGHLLSQKNLNDAITHFKYDRWGKLTQKTTPDSITTLYHTAWADGGDAPTDALYYSDTYYDGKFKGAEYFDMAGNSLRKVTTGYKGAKYYTDTKYYSAGQDVEISEPYLAGTLTSRRSIYSYDYLNRLVILTRPDSVRITYTYNGNTTTTRYSTGELYDKTYDAAGLLKTSTDPGGFINYYYNSLGKTRRIESPGSIIEMNFNSYGQQDTLKDPNAGKTSYAYNAYGELISQTDPKGNTALTYDSLGRIKTKTMGTQTTTYTYDKGTHALGTLTSVSRADGAAESYAYSSDGLCRIKSKTRSKGTDILTYHYAYDTKGRVDTMFYPAGFAIKYKYNDYSDLTAIYNTKNASNPIWKIDGVNEKGQLQNATYGNGKQITYGYDTDNRLNRIYVPGIMDFNYKFNDKQQLEYRDEKYDNGSGVMQGLHEVFTYDGVNRLQSATGAGNLQMTYTSIVNDRIASKSDAGAYVYNNLTNHRLDTVKGVPGYLPPNHTISFTAEHMVDTVKEAGKILSLSYGIDNQRFKTQYGEGSNLKYTRYYFDAYEMEFRSDLNLRHLNYVYAAGKLVAINVQKIGKDSMYYIYTDYLGSLRCITDSIGNIKQRLSYDAWGNRRDPITGQKLVTTNGLLFARGFTGHEHLDELGLINMNGRMYDPALGIFISPDNFVQAPDFTQNYNRYAYCLNNPLMYSDPSGDFFFLTPGFSFSPQGGFGVSLSAGIGFPNGLSAQFTVGYEFDSKNLYATVGATAGYTTAYFGYGSQSGWMSGVSIGLGSLRGFSTNAVSAGLNYSQYGGWGGNFSALQFNESGTSFDLSVGYSHTFYSGNFYTVAPSSGKCFDYNNYKGHSEEELMELGRELYFEPEDIDVSKITDTDFASGKLNTADDGTLEYKKGKYCYGVTHMSLFWSNKIYISPLASSNPLFLRAVLGHELTHAWVHTYYSSMGDKSERTCYEVEAQILNKYRGLDPAIYNNQIETITNTRWGYYHDYPINHFSLPYHYR